MQATMENGNSCNRVHHLNVTSKSNDGKATTVLHVHNLRCADLRKEFERVLVASQVNAQHTVDTEECGPALLFLALRCFAFGDREIGMIAAKRASQLNPRSRLGTLLAQHAISERLPKSHYPYVATNHILGRVNFPQVFSAVLRHTGLEAAANDADRLKRPRLIVHGCRNIADIISAPVMGSVKSLTLLDLDDAVLQDATKAILAVTGALSADVYCGCGCGCVHCMCVCVCLCMWMCMCTVCVYVYMCMFVYLHHCLCACVSASSMCVAVYMGICCMCACVYLCLKAQLIHISFGTISQYIYVQVTPSRTKTILISALPFFLTTNTGGRLPACLRLAQSTIGEAELPKSWGNSRDTFVILPMVLGSMSELERMKTLRSIAKRGFRAIILDFARFGNHAADTQVDTISSVIDAFEQGSLT
jgi:hypothetical protein